MEKEKLISKLNIKDYNNKLEKILSKKDFTEDTKNLLLNMLYKVENAYQDYTKVTQNIKSKNEILEEILSIIEKDCNKIEITDQKQSTILAKEKKIITYLNATKILYEIYQIAHEKFKVADKYEVIKKSMEDTLNEGYSIASSEVIRDFDGWSWNIITRDIENYKANFVYQTLNLLVGQNFLEEWRKHSKQDNLIILSHKLKTEFGEELAEKILTILIQVCVINVTEKNTTEKEKLLLEQEELQKEFDEINDKKIYLDKIENERKELLKKIKRIDTIINDDKKLKKDFIAANELLDMKHRFFSLSDYVDKVEEERENLINEVKKISNEMEPLNYAERRNTIEKNLDILKDAQIDSNNIEIYRKKSEELIKNVIKALKIKIDLAKDKNEIDKIIYQLRYYGLIYVNGKKQIKDIINLDAIQKYAITMACKQRSMTIVSLDIKENYRILKYIFQPDIIELEKIYIKLYTKGINTILELYDEEAIYKTIKLDKITDLNIKKNKKIKLFI